MRRYGNYIEDPSIAIPERTRYRRQEVDDRLEDALWRVRDFHVLRILNKTWILFHLSGYFF